MSLFNHSSTSFVSGSRLYTKPKRNRRLLTPPDQSNDASSLVRIKIKNSRTAIKNSSNEGNLHRVRSTLAAHDRTQLETVFDYPIIPSIGRRFLSQAYVAEAWLFYPIQMGINPDTYSKEKFYSDLRPLVRFREPRFSFRDLMGYNGDKSPLLALKLFLRGQVSAGEHSKPISNQRAISEARIFGCTFTSYFLKRMNKRTKALKRVIQYSRTDGSDQQAVSESLHHYADETLELLSKGMYLLREMRLLLREAEQKANGSPYFIDIKTELKFVDEYCTYRFRDGLSMLMTVMNTLDPNFSRKFISPKLLTRCLAMNRLEHWYTLKKGYCWIDESSSEDDVEYYMYRRGTLKRRVWSVLYLKIRSRPLFSFQRQLGAMAAAGLASLWWIVAVYFISMRGSNGIGVIGGSSIRISVTDFWQSSGFLMVTAFMLAYVLKDRIKENSRHLFSGKIFKWIPDNSERILYHPPTESPIDVGNIAEFTRFESPAELPAEVSELRGKAFLDKLEADDSPRDIIHYKKVVEIYPRVVSRMDYPIRAIHDILRINISGYLTRFDDPQAGTDLLSVDGKVVSMKLPKVYHMDVVLKHALAVMGRKEREVVYDHFRLILNKRGILRIEKLPV